MKYSASFYERLHHLLQAIIIGTAVVGLLNKGTEKWAEPIARSAHSRLVLFGTRHANRNPEQFIETAPPRNWGLEGEMELNKFGHLESFRLGKALREFLGDEPKSADYFSSSAQRCKDTMKGTLDSLYSSVKNKEVSVQIDDPLLRMYSQKDCPRNDRVWQPISSDHLPWLNRLHHEKYRLLEYISENTGFNASISHAADTADNIMQMDKFGYSHPEWLAKPTLPGYTAETLKRDILQFSEAHQRACALDSACSHLMAGHWLHHILSNIRRAIEGETVDLIGYSSHTEVTLSVMRLLRIELDDLPTAAGFLVELRIERQEAHVRLLLHRPTKDGHEIVRAALQPQTNLLSGPDGFIPFGAFEAVVIGDSFNDWRTECLRE